MQVRNGHTGEIIEVPDGTPDDDIHAQFSGAQQQNVTPLAQSFAGGVQQAVPQLAQQLIQGPEQSTLPNIGGGAMVGLTPQQAQFTLQSAQQSNVDSMANKLQQQQMVQQSLEAEKDRSQVLKLRQQDLKNRIAETKMLTEQAKFEAQMKVKEKELEEAGVTQRKLAEINGPYTLNEGAERRQGSELLAENPKTFAPPQPAAPEKIDWTPRTIMMVDPETQQQVPVDAWVAPGQEPQVMAPAVPKETNQQSQGLSARDKTQEVFNLVSQMMKDQASQMIEPGDEGYMTREQMLAQAREFVEMATASAPDQGPGKSSFEQAIELESQVGKLRQQGKDAQVIGNEIVIFPPRSN